VLPCFEWIAFGTSLGHPPSTLINEDAVFDFGQALRSDGTFPMDNSCNCHADNLADIGCIFME
jgi:hypothetical protein